MWGFLALFKPDNKTLVIPKCLDFVTDYLLRLEQLKGTTGAAGSPGFQNLKYTSM